jgi:hypothetical protein
MCKFSFIVLIGLSLLFTSCKKQLPQLPSNKGIEKNDNTATLLSINHNLALKEDSVLKIFADSIGSFKKNDLGFWYKIYKVGKGLIIKDSVQCVVNLELMNLNFKIIQTTNKQIIIGKKQIVTGLEEGLKMMHKGDSATFVIPWYLAYGMKGDEPLIPPYTSLIFKIKVLN